MTISNQLRTFAAIAAAYASCAAAGDGTWTQTASSDPRSNYRDTGSTSYFNWLDAANWQDSFVPTTGVDAAALSNVPDVITQIAGSLRFQYIRIPGSAVTNAAISGNAHHVILCGSEWNNLVTVGDVSGFEGLIRSYYANSGLAFMQSTTVPYFSAHGLPQLNVVDAADSVTVKTLGGRGTVSKSGAGGLTIEDGSANAAVRLTGSGTLTLGGHSYPDSLVPGYTVRLDASAPGAVTAEAPASDGRRYVSEWRDVEHPAVKATQGDATVRPFLRENCLNGKPVLDFGAYWGTQESVTGDSLHEELGRPAWMSCASATIGSVFYVAEETCRTNSAPVVVGNAASGYFTRKFDNTAKTPTKSGLLFTEYLRSPFQTGDLRMDGMRVPFNHYEPHGFARWQTYSLVQDDVDETTTWNQIMADRDNRRGGARLAEIVSYPSTLSREQIRQNNAYLRKKWYGDAAEAADADVGTVFLAAAGNAMKIAVPAGKTANLPEIVRSASCTSAQPIKTGAGRLALDVVQPSSMTVSVEQGSVGFRSLVGPRAASAASSPAADPAVWLKADDVAERFTFTPENGTNFVSRWNDVRPEQTDEFASPNDKNGAYPLPWLEPDALNGKPVMNFGLLGSQAACGPALKFQGKASSPVEAFVVWRNNVASGDPWIFGTSGFEFTRSTNGKDNRILSAGNAHILALGAKWHVDGRPVDPQDVKLGDEFHVINFAAADAVKANLLCADRDDFPYLHRGGGASIAEIIYYNRILTEAERRQTEAYLMKKWLAADHPLSKERTLAGVAFADGVAPDIEVASDTTLGCVEGAGALSVSGSAKLTVQKPLPGSITSVAVDGATLSAPVDSTAEALIRTRAMLWLDASREDTFTFELDRNGDPTDRVLEWRDANGGIYSMKTWSNIATNPPTFVDVTVNGAARKAVDFHELCRFYDDAATHDCRLTQTTNAASSMLIAKNGAFNSAISDVISVAECFTVMADAQSPNWVHRGSMFCTKYDAINVFQRDANATANDGGQIIRSGATGAAQCGPAQQGLISMDGEEVPYTTKVKDFDFHVYSMQPTAKKNVQSIGLYRTGGYEWFYGGLKVCEQVYFADRLTEDERALVNDYLRKKWLGADVTVASSLSSVSVTNGGVFAAAAAGYVATSTASLDGQSGTINLPNLVVSGGALSFAFTASDACDSLTVNGALTLPASATVTLSAAEGVKPAPGVYTLLSATSFLGATDLTLVNRLPVGVTARLSRDGASVKVKICRSGSMMLFR